ncbi:MAG: hypothetical protein OER04_19580, partial [Cyclobacteriaceae bacterium]|nr:hypothetical protein [Cyclobacteriaceae bacterium]
TPQGQLISFETQRYYGGDKDAQLQTWLIEMLDYKEFQRIIIPYKCRVTWILPDGDFNWLNLEITELEFN